MLVVSNSSPLIALATIDRLTFLSTLFKTVLIPPAVKSEIAPSLPALQPWLNVKALAGALPTAVLRGQLGDGERQALALAMECKADLLIVDDLPARRIASASGLRVVGTLGILLAGKRHGLINALRPELDQLLKHSFFMSPQLYNAILRAAGES